MLDSQQDIIQLRQALQQAQEKVQALRTELYIRKGQSVPPAQPEEPIQPGQDDENTKIQEALSNTNAVIRIYERELHRIATTPKQAYTVHQSSTIAQQRGCLLTGGLTLGIIYNIVGYIFLPLMSGSFFGVIVGLIILTISLVCIHSLWNLQRVGYYSLAFLSFTSIFIGVIFGIFLVPILGILYFFALSPVVLLRWKYME